jgi:hypothetical protein
MRYARAIAEAAAQNRTGVFYICRTKPAYYVTDSPRAKPVSVVTITDDGVHVEGSPNTKSAPLPEQQMHRALREVWRHDHMENAGQ